MASTKTAEFTAPRPSFATRRSKLDIQPRMTTIDEAQEGDIISPRLIVQGESGIHNIQNPPASALSPLPSIPSLLSPSTPAPPPPTPSSHKSLDSNDATPEPAAGPPQPPVVSVEVLEYVAKIREAIANQSVIAQAQRQRERKAVYSGIPEGHTAVLPSSLRLAAKMEKTKGAKKGRGRTPSWTAVTAKAKDGVSGIVVGSRRVVSFLFVKTRGVDNSQEMTAVREKEEGRSWTAILKKATGVRVHFPSSKSVWATKPKAVVAPTRSTMVREISIRRSSTDSETTLFDADDALLMSEAQHASSKYDLLTGALRGESRTAKGKIRKRFIVALNRVEGLKLRARHLVRKPARWSRV